MSFTTVSSAINFYENLENFTARFYEELAMNEDYSTFREEFLSLARDNIKQKETIIRTYRETITDILEVGSAMEGLKEDDYRFLDELRGDSDLKDVLRYAINLEDESARFCRDFSNKIQSLLTDIGRSFESAAKRKVERKKRLEDLLESLG